MNENKFDELLKEACRLWVEEKSIDEVEKVKFSRRHERRMKKFFRDVRKGKYN